MNGLQRTIVIVAVLALGAVALALERPDFAGMCLTGALGLAVPQKREDEPAKPVKLPLAMLAIVLGLGVALSACGASQKVTTQVRVADTAVIEYMLAHGCEDGKTMLAARELVVESLKVQLARVEEAACAGSVPQRIASLVADAAGQNVAAFVAGLLSDGCRAPFRAWVVELDEGTVAAKIALEDICATEGGS